MQRQIVVPNLITYGALISAFEKGTQAERGLEVLYRMRR